MWRTARVASRSVSTGPLAPPRRGVAPGLEVGEVAPRTTLISFGLAVLSAVGARREPLREGPLPGRLKVPAANAPFLFPRGTDVTF